MFNNSTSYLWLSGFNRLKELITLITSIEPFFLSQVPSNSSVPLHFSVSHLTTSILVSKWGKSRECWVIIPTISLPKIKHYFSLYILVWSFILVLDLKGRSTNKTLKDAKKNLKKKNYFFAMAQNLGISLEQAGFQAQSLYSKVYVLFWNVLAAPCSQKRWQTAHSLCSQSSLELRKRPRDCPHAMPPTQAIPGHVLETLPHEISNKSSCCHWIFLSVTEMWKTGISQNLNIFAASPNCDA